MCARVHVGVGVCTRVSIHVLVNALRFSHAYACIYIYIYICMYVYIYICVYDCIYDVLTPCQYPPSQLQRRRSKLRLSSEADHSFIEGNAV